MNSHHFHAVVWIDHHEARVFHFGPADVERLVLHPDHPTKHIHHKANSIGSGHASEDHAFLQAVDGAWGIVPPAFITRIRQLCACRGPFPAHIFAAGDPTAWLGW